MTTQPEFDSAADADRLLCAAAKGDRESWGALLVQHRERLRRMVALRLDQRLKGRLDPSDVVQEACLEASQRLKEYLHKPDMPFFLWLRFLTGQKLVTLHRHHFGMKMRDVAREVPLDTPALPDATSAALAAGLMGREPRPSEVAMEEERRQQFQLILESLDPSDREIIALRHYEQLSNGESARVLHLDESAASKRYIRAIRRLRELLKSAPDIRMEWQP